MLPAVDEVHDLVAADVRQAQVQQDQVEWHLLQQGYRLAAAGGGVQLDSPRSRSSAYSDCQQARFVVDQQQPARPRRWQRCAFGQRGRGLEQGHQLGGISLVDHSARCPFWLAWPCAGGERCSASGSSRSNDVPRLLLRQVMVPPIFWTRLCTMLRPRPRPAPPLVLATGENRRGKDIARYAGAVVADAQFGKQSPVAIDLAIVDDFDFPAARQCLDRVLQQVHQHLLEQVGAAFEHGFLILQIRFYRHGRRHVLGVAEQPHHVADHAAHFGRLPAADRLEVGQSMDDLADAVDFLVQDGDFADHDVLLAQAAVEYAKVILDDGQRIVDFMRDPARRRLVLVGDAGNAVVDLRLVAAGDLQCVRGLRCIGQQKAVAPLQFRGLVVADAADQHADAAARYRHRQADQAVGAQQAEQLLLGQGQQFPVAPQESDLSHQRRIGDRVRHRQAARKIRPVALPVRCPACRSAPARTCPSSAGRPR